MWPKSPRLRVANFDGYALPSPPKPTGQGFYDQGGEGGGGYLRVPLFGLKGCQQKSVTPILTHTHQGGFGHHCVFQVRHLSLFLTLLKGLAIVSKAEPDCGWTKPISHHLETVVETISLVRGINSVNQGFCVRWRLRKQILQPSTTHQQPAHSRQPLREAGGGWAPREQAAPRQQAPGAASHDLDTASEGGSRFGNS